MRLIPGTRVVVALDDEEHHLVLVVASGDGNERLNVAAPLAVLLGSMAPGSVCKAWTPRVAGAESMRVELVKVEVMR